MTITSKVVSSNRAHGEVYLIQHCVIKFVDNLRQVGGFSLCTQVFSTNKTNGHDITEILLKVALNTITLTLQLNFLFNNLFISFSETEVFFNFVLVLF